MKRVILLVLGVLALYPNYIFLGADDSSVDGLIIRNPSLHWNSFELIVWSSIIVCSWLILATSLAYFIKSKKWLAVLFWTLFIVELLLLFLITFGSLS